MRKLIVILWLLALTSLQASQQELPAQQELPLTDFMLSDFGPEDDPANFDNQPLATAASFADATNPSSYSLFNMPETDAPTNTKAKPCTCTDKEGSVALHFAMRHNAFDVENLPCPLQACPYTTTHPKYLLGHIFSTHKISLKNITITLFCENCCSLILDSKHVILTNLKKDEVQKHRGHKLLPQIEFTGDAQNTPCKKEWVSLITQNALLTPLETSKHPSTTCSCKNATNSKRNILFHHFLTHNSATISKKNPITCPLKLCDNKRPSQSSFQIHLKEEHQIVFSDLPIAAFCLKCNVICPYTTSRGNPTDLADKRKWLNDHFYGPFKLVLDPKYFTKSSSSTSDPSIFKEEWLAQETLDHMQQQTLEIARVIEKPITCECKNTTFWMAHFALKHNKLPVDNTLCPLAECPHLYGSQTSNHLERMHGKIRTEMPFILHCISCTQTHENAGKCNEQNPGIEWAKNHVNHELIVLIDPRAQNQHLYKKDWSMPPFDPELLPLLKEVATTALDVSITTPPTREKRKDNTPHATTDTHSIGPGISTDIPDLDALPPFPEDPAGFGFGFENLVVQNFNFEDFDPADLD